MRKIGEALRLRASGWTMREISVSLDAGRSTISEYLKRAEMAGLTSELNAQRPATRAASSALSGACRNARGFHRNLDHRPDR